MENSKIASDKVEKPYYSVVLPAFNEEKNIAILVDALVEVMAKLERQFEIIFVSDGSSDGTWQLIKDIRKTESRIKGISFRRNFGHQYAILAGLQNSSGDVVGIMDCDGEDPPDVLAQMFREVQNGYDVVYGVRRKREVSVLKNFSYKLFYRLLRKLVPFDIPLDSGDFCVMTRPVVETISNLSEKDLFLRGLRSWYGGRQKGIVYDRKRRETGQSKYSFWKLLSLGIVGITSFSRLPLRLITIFGFFVSVTSFFSGMFFLFYKLIIGIPIPGWTTLLLATTFIGGVQVLMLGVVGEYVGTIFEEIKMRPRFAIDEKVGLDANLDSECTRFSVNN